MAHTIGWKERIDFPEWRLRRVRAKIDTGARSSALGVAHYTLADTPDGPVVEIDLTGLRRTKHKQITVPVLKMVLVKNSGGCSERRPMIEALVRIGPVEKRIRLTLTDRATMRHPMLLGRTTLAGDFVVDVAGRDLLR